MRMKIHITLTSDMLGTKPDDPKVFESYVASKAPDDDTRKAELDSLEHVEKAGTTVFLRDPENGLYIKAYQFLGFLKAAGEVMRQTKKKGTGREVKGKEWGAIKGKMDRFVVIQPNHLFLNKDKADSVLERPLRAPTPQGERVALARSEVVVAGTEFDVVIDVLEGASITKNMLEDCLNYGARVGLGQWRNAGHGRFEWKEVKEKVA